MIKSIAVGDSAYLSQTARRGHKLVGDKYRIRRVNMQGGVTMYAIIQTGGKQYRVTEGDVLMVEKLEVAEGEVVEFDQVLTVVKDGEVMIGKPLVAGAKVAAKIMTHGKGKKIRVFKYKAKSNYRRRQGHRQPFTKIVIEKIYA